MRPRRAAPDGDVQPLLLLHGLKHDVLAGKGQQLLPGLRTLAPLASKSLHVQAARPAESGRWSLRTDLLCSDEGWPLYLRHVLVRLYHVAARTV